MNELIRFLELRSANEFYIEWLAPILEIAILTVMFYGLFLTIDRVAAGGKIKGMGLVITAMVVAAWGAQKIQLYAISYLLQTLLGFSAIIFALVFQPEMRRLFIRLGGFFSSQDTVQGDEVIQGFVEGMGLLSQERVGALVVFERNDHLDNYVAAGPFECSISERSLRTIFWKNSPVHDGAVIIRSGRIVAAGVILPLTQNPEYRNLSGTRHRAAIGISEDTDALVVLVSEETGQISVADKGKLTKLPNKGHLRDRLIKEFGPRGRRLTNP